MENQESVFNVAERFIFRLFPPHYKLSVVTVDEELYPVKIFVSVELS